MGGFKTVGGGLAAVVAALAVALHFRRNRHWPMREGQELAQRDFVMCETAHGEPCSRSDPSRWLQDFYGVLATRASEIAATGRPAVVVHIGASNFHDDIPEYLPLLHAIRSRAQLRLLLVEPEPAHRETLQKIYMRLGLDAGEVIVVSAAMNRQCGAYEVQYTWSDQLFIDFANETLRKSLSASLKSWRSFEKSKLLDAVRYVGTKPSFQTGEGSAENFDHFHQAIVPAVRRIYQAGNYSEYIVEEKIPCLNASLLVREAAIQPSDIVMSTIDAEGFDVPILLGFTDLPGFRPMLQRWEGLLKVAKLHNNPAKELVSWFREHQYKVGESGQSHSHDVVAYFGPPV